MGLNSMWVSLIVFATTACWHRASNLFMLRSKTWTWNKMSTARNLYASDWIWAGKEWSRQWRRLSRLTLLDEEGEWRQCHVLAWASFYIFKCCQSFCADQRCSALHTPLLRLGKDASLKGWETDHLVLKMRSQSKCLRMLLPAWISAGKNSAA